MSNYGFGSGPFSEDSGDLNSAIDAARKVMGGYKPDLPSTVTQQHVDDAALDVVKNANGNASAGVRARRGLRLLKSKSAELVKATKESINSHQIVELAKRQGVTESERAQIFERLNHYVGDTFTTTKYDLANAITNLGNDSSSLNTGITIDNFILILQVFPNFQIIN